MKRKVKIKVPAEKRGLFGFKKTVMATRTVEVDGKTFQKIKNHDKYRPYSVEEMMFYDDIFDEW